MKRIFAILMAALLLLPACTKEIRTETLKLEEDIPLHEGSTNNLSLFLDIDFPVSGFTQEGLATVRQAIRTHTMGDGYAGFTGSIEELGQLWRNNVSQDYLSTNQAMLEELEMPEEDAPFLNWGFDYRGAFGETYQHYVNYLVNQYEYLGGAHGMTCNFPLVFDLKDGQIVEWSQFAPGISEERMVELLGLHKLDGLKEMIGDEEIDPENIFFHETIEPSEWYSVNEKGLTFYYQPYDIAPYVFGVITIPVPWEELK